jgi:hypothetical protein
MGIAPLYNSFSEIEAAVHALKRIVVEGIQNDFSAGKATVT